MKSDVLLREAALLGPDIRENLVAYYRQTLQSLEARGWKELRTVYLAGCGDSHHAACAAQMAFQTLAGVHAVPMAANAFVLDNGLALHRRPAALIAVSASGKTSRVVDALARASKHGMLSLSITGSAGGAVAQGAEAHLVVGLRHPEPAPGVRTFQASLLGLLLLAIRLGELNGALTPDSATRWISRLASLAELLDALPHKMQAASEALAHEVAASPFVFFVGSGPARGSAMHAAAKMIEASGRLAVACDSEEWWHIERFAQAGAAPLIVFAAEGESAARAVHLAERACALGRRVALVAPPAVAGQSAREGKVQTLVYPDGVPEILSPFVHAVPSAVVAGCTAHNLGRRPFQGNEAS